MATTRVSWAECLVVGLLVFGLAGTTGVLLLLVGLIRLVRADDTGWDGFDPTVVAFAATAAALAGVLAWRRIVATPDARPWRGALAGLVVGLAAHPLCWFLLTAFLIARDPSLRSGSLYDSAFSLAFMTLMATFSSVMLVGWISAPLGPVLGYLWIRVRRRLGSHGSPYPANP